MGGGISRASLQCQGANRNQKQTHVFLELFLLPKSLLNLNLPHLRLDGIESHLHTRTSLVQGLIPPSHNEGYKEHLIFPREVICVEEHRMSHSRDGGARRLKEGLATGAMSSLTHQTLPNPPQSHSDQTCPRGPSRTRLCLQIVKRSSFGERVRSGAGQGEIQGNKAWSYLIRIYLISGLRRRILENFVGSRNIFFQLTNTHAYPFRSDTLTINLKRTSRESRARTLAVGERSLAALGSVGGSRSCLGPLVLRSREKEASR